MSEQKVWSKEDIKNLLSTNDKAVCRGLVTLFSLQTASEQQTESTSVINGVGFNGTDAEILSSFSKQFIKKGYLSPKQMVLARKKIMKYAGQLAKVANGLITVQYVTKEQVA